MIGPESTCPMFPCRKHEIVVADLLRKMSQNLHYEQWDTSKKYFKYTVYEGAGVSYRRSHINEALAILRKAGWQVSASRLNLEFAWRYKVKNPPYVKSA